MEGKYSIPNEAKQVLATLEQAGFEAYLVGGCVRDLLMNKSPKDWDITTNAKPEEIISLFPKTIYENNFGTVAIVQEDAQIDSLKVIEVTPYRIEEKYSDNRHPDRVLFSQNLKDDLQRRDFTVNAMTMDSKGQVIDLFGGLKDIKDKILRTVGEPDKRFQEDALRLMRAIRFSTQLGFTVSQETAEAISRNSRLIINISAERVRDEFIKIISSNEPMMGMVLLERLGLLQYIIPELMESVGIDQKGEHIYDVWEHLLRSLQHSADKEWPLAIRISALFHDVGKPRTRREASSRIGSKTKKMYTFYGHEVVGAKMAAKIMDRMKFPNKLSDMVVKLVRYHMFFSDPEQITLSAVRRLVKNVGPELVWDLMKVRICDRIGMGKPKEEPYRLRKYESMIEEAMRAPVSVGMLKIDGARIMEITGEKPGPKIGLILHALLEEMLEDPSLNTEEYLEKRSKELILLPIEDLKKLGEAGKEKKEIEEEKELLEIRKRYNVK